MPKNLNDDSKQEWEYPGFLNPTTTPVPDEFFDIVAPRLTEAELRVALYIIRRTYGFKKTTDTISLKQMVEGIRTRDGRVLDSGVGVQKAAVVRAIKGLVRKGIITATRNMSPDKGYEPSTYALKQREGERNRDEEAIPTAPLSLKETRVGTPKRHGVISQRDMPLSPQRYIQQTVLQETDIQHHSVSSLSVKSPNPDDDDTARILKKFGVSPRQARKLAAAYSQYAILEKLEIVQYLQSQGSPLVQRNPQGFLVRAIEDDFQPPRGYKTQAQQEQEEAERKRVQEAMEQAAVARRKAMDEFMTNQSAKRIPGTRLTTKTAWERTLKELEFQVSRPNFQTWLKDSACVGYTDGVALIAVPTDYAAQWLTQKLSPLVVKVLSTVVGQPIDIQFESLPEMTIGTTQPQQPML